MSEISVRCVGSASLGGALSVIAIALLMFSGVGCVRLSSAVPGDSTTGPSADVARSDGSGDGPPKSDGPLDGPKGDGPPELDGAKPDQQAGDAKVVPATWVTIAKGTFTMGAYESCGHADETPHQVTLTNDFEIQSTEVTRGQFSSLMGYDPSQTSCVPGASCPVDSVSWHEAAAYCNALSFQAGKEACYTCSGGGASVTCQEATSYSGQKVYDCPGYRLPTEAEWEYAYRAGTTTPYYSGGNDGAVCNTCATTDANADKIGWYCANSGNSSHPIKGKQPNAWVLYDMAGNISEWCHDRYGGGYGSGSVTDPWGAPSGSSGVLRGGSWSSGAGDLRAADRGYFTPALRGTFIGFRR